MHGEERGFMAVETEVCGAVSVFGGCLWFLAWAPGFPALDDPQQGGAMFFHAAATSTVTHGQPATTTRRDLF